MDDDPNILMDDDPNILMDDSTMLPNIALECFNDPPDPAALESFDSTSYDQNKMARVKEVADLTEKLAKAKRNRNKLSDQVDDLERKVAQAKRTLQSI